MITSYLRSQIKLHGSHTGCPSHYIYNLTNAAA